MCIVLITRSLLGISCIFLVAEPLAAQTTSAHKLTVQDFKGKPDPNAPYLATTFTLLSYQYGAPSSCPDASKIRFTFQTALQVGDKSWMKLDRIRSKQLLQELLEHEQGHYDIAETLSVQLRRSLSLSCFDRSRYKFQIDSIYKGISRYYDTLQVRYDTETRHGQDKEAQQQWKLRIETLHRSMLKQ